MYNKYITDKYLYMFCFFNKYVKIISLGLTFNVTIFTKLSIDNLKFINDDCNMRDNLAKENYITG